MVNFFERNKEYNSCLISFLSFSELFPAFNCAKVFVNLLSIGSRANIFSPYPFYFLLCAANSSPSKSDISIVSGYVWLFIICFITCFTISLIICFRYDKYYSQLSKNAYLFVQFFVLFYELIIIFASSEITSYICLASFLLIIPLTMSFTNFSSLFIVIFLLFILVLNPLSLASVILLCISLNLFFVCCG